MSKRKNAVFVFDLDGVIISSLHRYKTIIKNGKKVIDLAWWRALDTPEHIAKDTLLPLAEMYKRLLSRPNTLIIAATARACVKGDANYKFLKDNGLFPDVFIHRQGVNDTRKGAALKIEGIKPHLNTPLYKDARLFIYEDNPNYLRELTRELNPKKSFLIPSKQGH